MRRFLLTAVTTLVFASSGLLVAVPATASTSVNYANCKAALNGQTFTVPSGTTNLNIGFTSCNVTTPAASSGSSQTNPNLILSTSANPPQPGGGNNPSYYTITGQLMLNVSSASSPGSISGSKPGGPGPIPDGIYTVYFGYFDSGQPAYYGSFIIDVGGSGGGGASSSGSSSAPAPVMQQFGKPASGTCEAAAPITLNWGGAGSGGWGESWAQWMNGGLGGAVCTRTLVYSDSAGAWTVA